MHIVLHQPEIPPNTGNVARLCVCNDFELHLIHPLGFSLSQKRLKRAGLDYWRHLRLTEHASWEHFLAWLGSQRRSQLHFFSARAKKNLWQARFSSDSFLVFGSETRGLPDPLHRDFSDHFYRIPMRGTKARCLNLSDAASIAAYEALRQQENT